MKHVQCVGEPVEILKHCMRGMLEFKKDSMEGVHIEIPGAVSPQSSSLVLS